MSIAPGSNNLAAKVRRTLAQRQPGFELTDGDIALEHGMTRRQVHMHLEPYVKEGTLAQRVDNSIHHYSLPGSLVAMAIAQPAAPATTWRSAGNGSAAPAPSAAGFDPDAVQPKAFVDVPQRNGWSQRAAHCHAILNKLIAPQLFIDGIPKAYESSLKRQAQGRSYMGVERYSFRKPTPGTIAIYRIADAQVPLPAPATSKAKAVVRKPAGGRKGKKP